MKLDDLTDFKKTFNSELYFDFEVKKLNWFNIGGKTKIFFKPKNLKELKEFLNIYSNRGKIFTIGSGSNILFKDETFDGVIIKLSKNFSSLSKLKNDTIIAGSSCQQKKLASFAMENEISGFEFMYCIPGSVGGGLKMNSGCFGSEFKDRLISLQCIDTLGNIKLIPSNKIKFNYRSTKLDENLIFLSATFKGSILEKNKIRELMEDMSKKKNNSQPSKIKTGGSTFKNPIDQTSKKAWELIKTSVPEDTNFGDAYISEKHSNFFVNKKNASFHEMNSLINFVKKKVKDKTGININLEIKII
tara:strand:- start:13807 stop:14712 length:906 start_codon:yes stop_codon:yes gene_type:complete